MHVTGSDHTCTLKLAARGEGAAVRQSSANLSYISPGEHWSVHAVQPPKRPM